MYFQLYGGEGNPPPPQKKRKKKKKDQIAVFLLDL
jgi:hypothetical protein